tara:strand:- start:24710 stop:25462 length:753 start_codon:yes stop_codon:yes gene_type:complete
MTPKQNIVNKTKAKQIFFAVIFSFILIYNTTSAMLYPRVERDLTTYDKNILKMKSDFLLQPQEPTNKTWVKNKIDNMVKIDQYMRKFWDTPLNSSYTPDEKNEFHKQFSLKSATVDSENTADLKELLKIYTWFKISEFGANTESQAWLLVQHADQDHEFQENVLKILEKLWPLNETKPSNYAYLYDRVASSFGDPNKRKLQRYGTQGRCVGPGQWEPLPIENPEKVDELRKSVGLSTLAEYKMVFKNLCH